jgi:signal transduction histidine kinase
LVLSDYGRAQMDIVRDLCDRLLRLQAIEVATGRTRMEKTMLLNRFGVSAMTALSLLALYMYLRQSTALVQQREVQRRLVQTERDQLENEVMRRTEQLTGLARHLERVREDERDHLARELHDELGAVLTAAKLDVARLKSRLGEVQPDVQERVRHLNEGLNSGIALKRRIIEDLRPSSLINLGLMQALEILISEWTQRTEIPVNARLETVTLRASAELTVYRLVQEALTNVAKYAKASEVWVKVSPVSSPESAAAQFRVHVSVRDNGVGFDASERRIKTHGLLGMEFRIETEGGVLAVTSSPGLGTLVSADLPESADPAKSADPTDGTEGDAQRSAA